MKAGRRQTSSRRTLLLLFGSLACLLAIAVVLPGQVSGGPRAEVELKIATLAPEGTPPVDFLHDVDAEVRNAGPVRQAAAE